MGPDDLLLQVLLSPHDEALRAVYVDSLLEQGDMRGEHARLLRLGRTADAESLARAHVEQWLPPSVARFVVKGSARFRDGLLDACALLPMSAFDAKTLAAEPLWGAVRELHDAPWAVIAQASSLERLSGVDDQLLAELLGWNTALPRLRHLGLRVDAPGTARLNVMRLAAPKLESLSFVLTNAGENARHRFPSEAEAQCCEECARPREPVEFPEFQPSAWSELSGALWLRTLELHAGFVHLGRFIAALEQTRFDLDALRLRGAEENGVPPAWCLRLEKTAPGRYQRLVIETEPDGDEETIDVHELLVTAPASLEIEPSRFDRPRWRQR